MTRNLRAVAMVLLLASCGDGDSPGRRAPSADASPRLDAGSRTFGYNTTDGFYYASHNWPLVNNHQVQQATLTEPGLLTAIRTYFYTVKDAPGSAMRVRGLVYADNGQASPECSSR